MHSPQTNFTFEDTLTQIGLGYPILFLLGFRPPRWQWTALGVILGGYWLAWALYPSPARASTSRPSAYRPTGSITTPASPRTGTRTAIWGRRSTVVPESVSAGPSRSSPIGGGYLTLSFIPTLGTMILGLVAGRWLRGELAARSRCSGSLIAGVIGIAAGLLLHFPGICPIVKRIWTPSWTLVQRRRLLPVPGRIQLGDRREGLQEVGVPAGRDRHEFDRGLPDRAPVRRVHHQIRSASTWAPTRSRFSAPGCEPFVQGWRCCRPSG